MMRQLCNILAIGAMLGALAGSPAGATGAAAVAAGDDELDEIDLIELELEQYRRMTVPVTIQGQGPFRFMIDTGAQATVVSHGIASRLELEDHRTANRVGMASTRTVTIASISDVALGSRNFHVHSAPLVDAARIGDADGILGLDSLQNQRVLLDFENSTIAVADAEALGGNRGFEIVVKARRKLGQLIISRAKLNGISVAVLIDTGAQGSIGNFALLEKLRRARALGEGNLTDINGHAIGGTVRMARELQLGRAQLANLPVMFIESPSFAAMGLADEPALVLGMNELRLFRRVAIDFSTRRVLFDMPNSVTRREIDRWSRGFGS